MKDNDAIFKKIAKTYVDNLGEKAKLENETQHIALDTGRLDEKVAEKLKVEKLELKEQKGSGQKIRKFSKALMPIAACFVIVGLFVAIQSNFGLKTAEKSATEELAYEAEEPTYDAEEPTYDTEEVPPEPADRGQMIPLPALPKNLSVIGQEFVNETSIYRLRDEQANSIIIEMKYGQIDSQEIADMQETQVGGHKIYQEDIEAQKRIIFEREGIVYMLASDTSIDILISICEYIL